MVHGTRASINEFPWQISLEFIGSVCWLPEWIHNCYSQHCGGFIIDTKFIVTAAHCFNQSENVNDYIIRAGTNTSRSGGSIFALEKIKIHPLYRNKTLEFDIAVLQLKSKMKFSDTIKKIEMSNILSVEAIKDRFVKKMYLKKIIDFKIQSL